MRPADRRAAALLAFVMLIVLPTAGRTQSVAGDADESFQLGGSVRTLAAAVEGRGVESGATPAIGGFDQTLVRLTVEARPSDHVTFELHVVQSYTYASASTGLGSGTTPGFGLAAGDTRYRAVDATADWFPTATQAASLWVDRLNVKVTLPRADITIGRQAISFGKAYFWNPLDEFLPFDARQIDRDYKAGVDAIKIDIPRGQFSGVNVVAAFGRELTAAGTSRDGDRAVAASWYGSAALARYFTTVRGWDAAAQAGKVYGGYQLGGAVTGEIHQFEIRGEAAYLWAMPRPPLPAPLSGHLVEDHLAAVGGIGKRFQNTLWIELEHFHNGAGQPENLDAALVRFTNGAALNLGREITGITASYELLPIVTGQIAALHSWSDGSSQIQPTVTYSVSDNSDLLAGLSIGIGPAPARGDTLAPHLTSEFGSFPRAYFVELKWYF
jgi:hypothetical protein